MDHYAKPLTRLINELGRLPGIGGKTAQRLAFHILSLPDDEARSIADAIVNAKMKMKYCSVYAAYAGIQKESRTLFV